jgi:hypothetical protein
LRSSSRLCNTHRNAVVIAAVFSVEYCVNLSLAVAQHTVNSAAKVAVMTVSGKSMHAWSPPPLLRVAAAAAAAAAANDECHDDCALKSTASL